MHESTQPTRRSRNNSSHAGHVSMERSGRMGEPRNRSRAKLRRGTRPIAIHTRRLGRPKKRVKITNVTNCLSIEKKVTTGAIRSDRSGIYVADFQSRCGKITDYFYPQFCGTYRVSEVRCQTRYHQKLEKGRERQKIQQNKRFPSSIKRAWDPIKRPRLN
jgi:hypothetical protein